MRSTWRAMSRRHSSCALRCTDRKVLVIIAMSSRVTDGQIGQLQQCGFDSVLRKPFTVRQVIEAVEAAHAVIY